MTDPMIAAERCLVEARKLSNGKQGYAAAEKPGYLRHVGGQWRSPELHAKILELLGRSLELNPRDLSALRTRSLEKYNVGDLDGAEADFRLLVERGGHRPDDGLPIWIALARGDRNAAKTHLEVVNAENKRRGLPKSKLSDFEPL